MTAPRWDSSRCRLCPWRYNRPWPRASSASFPARRKRRRWRAPISPPPCTGWAAPPAVAIASASLDFPIPPSLTQHGQRVLIATGRAAPADKLAQLRAQGCEVIAAGQGRYVEGAPLTRALGARGFRSLFLLAGPRLLETMLRDRVLSRLYLTIAHCLLGGTAFHSLIAGPELE